MNTSKAILISFPLVVMSLPDPSFVMTDGIFLVWVSGLKRYRNIIGIYHLYLFNNALML